MSMEWPNRDRANSRGERRLVLARVCWHSLSAEGKGWLRPLTCGRVLIGASYCSLERVMSCLPPGSSTVIGPNGEGLTRHDEAESLHTVTGWRTSALRDTVAADPPIEREARARRCAHLPDPEALAGSIMRTKRMLITGGAGFVGCNAARSSDAELECHRARQPLQARRRAEPCGGCARAAFDFEHVDIRNRVAVDRSWPKGASTPCSIWPRRSP